MLNCGIFVFERDLAKSDNTYVTDVSNKSLPRHETYFKETEKEIKVSHLSLDDFVTAFKDIAENEY